MGAYSILSHAINAFLDEGDEVGRTHGIICGMFKMLRSSSSCR